MLNEREKIRACALRGELRDWTILLAACAAAAVGLAAAAWLFYGRGYWEPLAVLTAADWSAALLIGWRLYRISRRIRQMETFR